MVLLYAFRVCNVYYHHLTSLIQLLIYDYFSHGWRKCACICTFLKSFKIDVPKSWSYRPQPSQADFDERSGTVVSPTEWGRWWQTLEEIYLEFDLPEGVTARQITCQIRASSLKVTALGKEYLDGELGGKVRVEESTWTLEDRQLLRVLLAKAHTAAKNNCWPTLMADGSCALDAFTKDQVERKLTLQRFQYDSPGMDFSSAEISGNYTGGGPEFWTWKNSPASMLIYYCFQSFCKYIYIFHENSYLILN